MIRRLLIVGLVLGISFALSVDAVYASSYSGTLSITCSGFSDLAPNTVTFDRDNTGTGNEAYQYVATDGAGTSIYTLSNQLPLGSYTLGSASFTQAPAYNPITVKLISPAGNGYSAQTIFSIQGTCAGLPTYGGAKGWEGPGIPEGFVLKTIVCNVAAVQSPGGPVVENIKALVPGATWFMNPTPVKDAQGKLWTEVFLGGYNNAFIPANCAA
jgi:hypothetical protein